MILIRLNMNQPDADSDSDPCLLTDAGPMVMYANPGPLLGKQNKTKTVSLL